MALTGGELAAARAIEAARRADELRELDARRRARRVAEAARLHGADGLPGDEDSADRRPALRVLR